MKKDTILTILIFTIITGSLFFLFNDGEKKLNKEASHGYTVIKFINANEEINLKNKEYPNARFSIKNLELKKNNYHIEYFIENELVDSLDFSINTDNEKFFTLTSKTIEQLTSIKEQTGENLSILINLKIVINWKNNKETIEKKIILE